MKQTRDVINALIISDDDVISLAELCRGCSLPAERVIRMIDYGIIEPLPRDRGNNMHWKFSALCVPRVQTAIRLQRDLDMNLAGTAVALDLLDEIKSLRQLVTVLRRD